MQRPWLAAIVILFWCLTTSWLVVEKILPALRTGSPPGYQALYASNNRLIPVAWTVHWNGQPLGWATSQSQTVDGGSICVESLLHLDRLPLDKILPVWIKPMLHRVSDPITFEARGSLLIDATGHRFMGDYDPRLELAPRDVVSKAIVSQMEKTQSPCVYLTMKQAAVTIKVIW